MFSKAEPSASRNTLQVAMGGASAACLEGTLQLTRLFTQNEPFLHGHGLGRTKQFNIICVHSIPRLGQRQI